MDTFDILTIFLKNLRTGLQLTLRGCMIVFSIACMLVPLIFTLCYGNIWYMVLYIITFPIGYALGESVCEIVHKNDEDEDEDWWI